MMNIIDLIIIYLACGSPFGVYHFLNNRQQNNSNWLRSVFVTIFWIPFAIKLLHQKVTKKVSKKEFVKIPYSDLEKEEKIKNLQKIFEDFLPKDNSAISLFEFREIIERYAGLTIIAAEENSQIVKHEKEIFRISEHTNVELAAKCLNRRNRLRLLSHQTQARKDFLKTLKVLFETNSDTKKLGKYSLEFVKLLKDNEAKAFIEKMTLQPTQIIVNIPVRNLEEDLWTPQELKQSNDKPTPIRLKTLTATANSRKKD